MKLGPVFAFGKKSVKLYPYLIGIKKYVHCKNQEVSAYFIVLLMIYRLCLALEIEF